MPEFYEMGCGCKIPMLNDTPKIYDKLPSIYIDYENLNLNCPMTWELFSTGNTKGVFQLEKNLGQNWSSKVKPVDIEELAALISLIRPGTLKAIVDGKTMSQHFVDRKDGNEAYEIKPHIIEDALNPTYGVILYQEQAMKISELVAGFNLKQADALRKAMGKKDAELMAKVRKDFIKEASNFKVIDDEQANEIFDIIEKSNRYSFNKSHAVGYGITGYWTAYFKAHFPLHFFCSWLRFAEEKQDEEEEILALVSEARVFNIDIRPPNILKSRDKFHIEDGEIITGLSNVANIGGGAALNIIAKVNELVQKLGKDLKDFTWNDYLLHLSPLLNKTQFYNLCATGTFDYLGMFRSRMLFEFNKINDLTGKHEITWLQENINNYKTLGDAMLAMCNTKSVSSGRKEKVKGIAKLLLNPPSELKDTDRWIADMEKQLIGAPLSCSKLDSLDLSACNTKCKEFKTSDKKNYIIGCQIDRASEYIPKSGKIAGKKMLYLTLSDSSGTIEAVMFPDAIAKYEQFMFEDNTVLISGKKSKSGSLTVDKVEQL